MLKVRAVSEADVAEICSFAETEDGLYFFFPAAEFPLTSQQLSSAIAQRADSTVVEKNGVVLGFANFYQWGM